MQGEAGCPDHHQNPPRPSHRFDQLSDRMRPDEAPASAASLDEPIRGMLASRRATVVHGYGVTLAFEVQSEILSHDGQSDQAYVCCFHALCSILVPTLSSSRGTVQFSRHVLLHPTLRRAISAHAPAGQEGGGPASAVRTDRAAPRVLPTKQPGPPHEKMRRAGLSCDRLPATVSFGACPD